MASTFNVFRKNQRTLMAVFGVLLMVAFSVSAVLPDMTSGGANQDPVVVTSRFGDFRASEISGLIDQRRLVQNFLFQVEVTGLLEQQKGFIAEQFKGEALKSLGPNWTRMLEQNIQRDVDNRLQVQFGRPSERSVVESKLMADLARREGVTISDEAVDAYIKTRTHDHVTNEQLQGFLANLSTRGSKTRVSKAQLYEALRQELAAMKVRDQVESSIRETPAQRWDYYRRLKRTATAEIAALPVDDFLGQVKDPSEAELRKFYDAHKNDEPTPGSAVPGFKAPHRAAFEYFVAQYDKFVDPAAITDAEVADYYEKNRQKYPYAALGDDDEPADAASETPPASGGASTADPAKKVPPQTEPATPGKNESPAGDKPAAVEGSCATDDVEPEPKVETATDTPKPDAPKPDAAKPDAAKPDAPVTDALKVDAPQTESRPAPTPDAAKTLDDVKNAPPGSIKPPENAPPVPTSRAPRLQDRFALPTDIKAGPVPQYQPLWKASDKIRKELAQQKAQTKMQQALAGLQAEMRQHAKRRQEIEQQNIQKGATAKPLPPGLDFKALADKAGVLSGAIPLASAFEVSQSSGLGKSTVGNEPFVRSAFKAPKTYISQYAVDADGNRYLFWKTQNVEAHIPELTEIRSDVIRAWKRIQARELAERKAQELAKKARAKEDEALDRSLADAGLTITKTGPFKWLDSGSASSFNDQTPVEIGSVEGVVDAGPDFMRAAFDLKVGDVATAFNEPKSVCYIIRLTTIEPSETVLRETFLADRARGFASAADADRRKLISTWRDDFLKQTALNWVQPPTDEDNR